MPEQTETTTVTASPSAVGAAFGSEVAALAQQERAAAAAATTFGLRIENREMSASLVKGMGAVDQVLHAAAGNAYPDIDVRSRYLVKAGGKRFRPLLTMLAAQFGDPTRTEVTTAAAACELTHIATLYHDDVMDEATVRRNVVSANVRYGNSVAVLCGDLLFTAAAQLMATLGLRAVKLQTETAHRLVMGQTLETVGPRPDDDPVEHYLAVIRDKTGSLTAACAGLGAMTAGCPDWMVDTLLRYGELVGVAFQISDDLLDITEPQGRTGKAPGTDLREGVETLPVLHVRANPRPEDARLLELLDGDLTDPAALREALELLRVHPALELARADLRRYVEETRACLPALPEVPARGALELLADVVGNRRR
jgi:heptaprenyl diphosphate synthase